MLPLLRTADEDDPERTAELLPEERTELLLLRATLWAELRDDAALRVDEVLLEEAVALEGVEFRETEAEREAEALREKDDTRDEPAMR